MSPRRLVALTLMASILAAPALAAERPASPPGGLSEAPLPSVAVCDDPGQARTIADNASKDVAALQNRMLARTKYRTALQLWKTERLIELKAWTREDARAFASAIGSDPGFLQMTKDNLAQLEVMSTTMSRANEALQGPDDKAACQAVLNAMQANLDLETLANKQWAIMDDRFDVAAKTAGVSLD